ncbi:MAG: ATP-dependent RecD-like DNA helicase, partial [Deltaproteobacteria bacterium]
MSQTLEGQVDRIVYSNDQNLYTVVRLKAKGIPEPVTVVGRLAGTTPGQEIRVSGKWETHTKYGRQFRANSYSISLPVQVQGIRKYLGSGLIQGIGPEMANRLVKRFGEKTLEVIEQRPKDLLDVEGIGEKRLQMILDAWEDQKEVRNVMIFLQGHGVSTGYSAKIFKQYGQDAIRVVTENPYRLATDIFGIGFAIADQIAEKINIPRNSIIRAEAGILHVLEKMTERGNVYGLYEDVLRQAEELLGIDQSILQRAFANLADSRRIV